MNDLVYPVHGGMEDWAYAGSWDPERVVQCQPKTYNGYDASKTSYDNSTLRVFNMLVETSDSKIPRQSDLGTSLDIMSSSQTGNGHVARNIRLALLALELVQPYVRIGAVNELNLSDDLVPLVDRSGLSCQHTKTVAVPHNSRKVIVQWSVGGSLTVDATSLVYAKWDDLQAASFTDCETQPDKTVAALLKEGTAIGATSGNTQFSATTNAPSPPFSASIDISDFEPGDQIAVFAKAVVDQDWTTNAEAVVPDVPPQSHIVNARTNPNWHHQRADGKVIQGRLDWYSVPVTIVLTKYDDNQVEAVEVSMRYDESKVGHDEEDAQKHETSVHSGGGGGGDNNNDNELEDALDWTLVIGCVAIVCIAGYVGGRTYLYYTMRKTHRERVREYIEDESAVTPGLKHIAGAAAGSKKKKGYADVTTEEPNGELELGEYADKNGGLA